MGLTMNDKKIHRIGNILVDSFHYVALFVIAGTVLWSAVFEYIQMMEKGRAELKDILLLFIYLELGAMTGIYFKTRRLPVQFLIFIAITALSRHLVIDVQQINNEFHLYLLIVIAVSIVLLSGALFVLSYTAKKYGAPEDDIADTGASAAKKQSE